MKQSQWTTAYSTFKVAGVNIGIGVIGIGVKSFFDVKNIFDVKSFFDVKNIFDVKSLKVFDVKNFFDVKESMPSFQSQWAGGVPWSSLDEPLRTPDLKALESILVLESSVLDSPLKSEKALNNIGDERHVLENY